MGKVRFRFSTIRKLKYLKTKKSRDVCNKIVTNKVIIIIIIFFFFFQELHR